MPYTKISGTSKKMWQKNADMDKSLKSVEVHLGRQGRLVIPATLRRSLGLTEGDKLIAREEAGRLVLEKQDTIKERLKARFAKVPQDRSLAEELIRERQEETKREAVE